jgi:hypothetical protein
MLQKREKDMSVNDYLNDREMKLSNRNTAICSATHNYLKVLHLAQEKIVFTDQKERLEHCSKMIK